MSSITLISTRYLHLFFYFNDKFTKGVEPTQLHRVRFQYCHPLFADTIAAKNTIGILLTNVYRYFKCVKAP